MRRLGEISRHPEEPEWLMEWRLKAFRAWKKWNAGWAKVDFPPIDYQALSYYSAPKQKIDAPKSLDEIDPELLETYEKLGIPLREQEMLAKVVAVDAVFDSVSVAQRLGKLEEMGIIFCSFSEAVKEHPEQEAVFGTVIPTKDNYFAALNSAVFSMVRSPCSKGRTVPDGVVDLFPY